MCTERASPRYSRLDVWDASDVLESMIEGQFTAVAAVFAARQSIESAAHEIEARLRHRGRLIYAGAGTSGRLALQDAVELMPTFNWPEERLLLLMAGGPEALLRSVEGAEDDAAQAALLIEQHAVNANDVLIAVAASGSTPFTLACLRAAKRRSALTVGIANNRATPILEESDFPIWLETGAEPIAGSTRLKAGTAQKITLNALSTLVMILLGKVYQGLMVDVRISNEKLKRRGEEMLVQLTGCGLNGARDALIRAGGSVKLAVLLLYGCELENAVELLNRSSGRLQQAIGHLKDATRT